MALQVLQVCRATPAVLLVHKEKLVPLAQQVLKVKQD